MSLRKRKAVAVILLALAVVGCSPAQNRYTMTPEEVKLYHLQLQQQQEQASKWATAHPAEARALWDKNAQSIEDNDRNFARFKRQTPQRPQPDQQHMCSQTFGSTVGLVPCP
ncbi:hypothetical protein PQR67_12975 [Paraburkholderia fungorum]|uniref:hypothetical protein n=1 Tax=Paraburkholderia fungorum TaxID=134537 RepID=UPI0038BAA5A5